LDSKQPGHASQELPPGPVRRLHACPPSPPAYPACDRFVAGRPPPGHITRRPPSATPIPPYHTHHTSGLMVKRNTACSVPFTTPASTTYRSSRTSLRIPTSVEG